MQYIRMKFNLTKNQILNKSKTVTRRLGFRDLLPGDQIVAEVRNQDSEFTESLARVNVVAVSYERLDTVTQEECKKERFPNLTPSQFVDFFCKAMGCSPETEVTRIEFEYL